MPWERQLSTCSRPTVYVVPLQGISFRSCCLALLPLPAQPGQLCCLSNCPVYHMITFQPRQLHPSVVLIILVQALWMLLLSSSSSEDSSGMLLLTAFSLWLSSFLSVFNDTSRMYYYFQLFWDRVSCNMGCPRSYCVTKDNLKLAHLPLPPECWDGRQDYHISWIYSLLSSSIQCKWVAFSLPSFLGSFHLFMEYWVGLANNDE